jgi:hypothetical protein
VILGDATSVRADQLGGKLMIVSTSILSELRFVVANFGPGSVEAHGANRWDTLMQWGKTTRGMREPGVPGHLAIILPRPAAGTSVQSSGRNGGGWSSPRPR